MRHAESNLFQAKLAAALDDLLKRRNHRLRAIQPEALGAGIFDVEEILEPLGLDQFAEDRALALTRELDFLVGSLDTLLNPGLLRRIRNMDEFEADGPAIGPPQDREHFAHGRIFEPEHMIDEDLAIVVGLLKAVGRRMELLMVSLRLKSKRIEIGVQMAAHAIGADHHERADGITRRPSNIVVAWRRFWPRLLRLGAQLLGDRLFRRRPIAVQRVDEVALGRRWPIGLAP